MKYRQSCLLAAKSITTAGTESLYIKAKDVISRLVVRIDLTNSSWTPTGHPAKTAVKVELVDGSDVLFSARGIYAQSIAFYQTGKQPFNYINFTDNGKATAMIPIYFGRYLYDEELALDPSKFDNLQLKVTHDYSLGGAVPDAATLEVWADFFDEKVVSPIGFLMTTTHWSKTLVQSTKDQIQLPVDHPIRLVIPAVSSDSEEPDINIDAIKVTEEDGKSVIIDSGVLELLQLYESMYPWWVEYGEGRTLANNDVSFYFSPAKDLQFECVASEDSDAIIHEPWSGGQKRIIDGSLTATIQIHAHGRCPHGAIPLPMGKQDDYNDWWDVASKGSARIDLTTGAGDTSALYELLVQQFRRY